MLKWRRGLPRSTLLCASHRRYPLLLVVCVVGGGVGLAGETRELVGCGLGFPSDRMYGFWVGAEHVEPVRQVMGMVWSWGGGEAEHRARERGGEFGDEFFDRRRSPGSGR